MSHLCSKYLPKYIQVSMYHEIIFNIDLVVPGIPFSSFSLSFSFQPQTRKASPWLLFLKCRKSNSLRHLPTNQLLIRVFFLVCSKINEPILHLQIKKEPPPCQNCIFNWLHLQFTISFGLPMPYQQLLYLCLIHFNDLVHFQMCPLNH